MKDYYEITLAKYDKKKDEIIEELCRLRINDGNEFYERIRETSKGFHYNKFKYPIFENEWFVVLYEAVSPDGGSAVLDSFMIENADSDVFVEMFDYAENNENAIFIDLKPDYMDGVKPKAELVLSSGKMWFSNIEHCEKVLDVFSKEKR